MYIRALLRVAGGALSPVRHRLLVLPVRRMTGGTFGGGRWIPGRFGTRWFNGGFLACAA